MIISLTPTLVRKIWGGQNLERLKNISPKVGDLPVGETWEVSVHPEGPSFIDKEVLVLAENEELPYLVKLIDTSEALSVQVHPDDEYARVHENSSGKSECWVILQASPGAGIYLGFKESVTREDFIMGIKNKKNMSEFLNFYPVSPGDFFYVPAKTIHAIGAGITLAEVQQSSGITYRVWDWDRVDSKGVGRELHIDKTLAVVNFDLEANTSKHFRVERGLFSHQGKREIIEHETFRLSLVNLRPNQSFSMKILKRKRLASLLSLEGEISVNGTNISSYQAVLFRDEPALEIKSQRDASFLIIE